MFCSDKFGFIPSLHLAIDLRSVFKSLKSTVSRAIQLKVTHHFDSALPIGLDS